MVFVCIKKLEQTGLVMLALLCHLVIVYFSSVMKALGCFYCNS